MKKKSAKIIALLLTFVMIFSLSGCGKNNEKKPVSNESPTKAGEQVKTDPTKEPDKGTGGETQEKTYDEFLTVDVFASEAN